MRGRFGVLLSPSILAFATAGLAWGRTDTSQATTFLAPPDVGGRTSGKVNHIGLAFGGGAEWAISQNWSLKGEYLYVNLGKENYMLTGVTRPVGGSPYVETFATDLTFHSVRAALNYRF